MLRNIQTFFYPNLFKIETERLIIRDFKKRDLIPLHRIANHPQVSIGISNYSGNVSYKRIADWIYFCKSQSRKNPRKNYELGIELKIEKKLIGKIDLREIDFENKKGTLGYLLDPNFWGKGYMDESAIKIINFAFNTLNLQRISADPDSDNPYSEYFLKRLGFLHEGTLRKDHIRYNGKVVDTELYGLLKK